MSAIFSPCGHYRLRLDRDCGLPIDGSKVFGFFGINPSYAGEVTNDPTVSKLHGFTIRNGGHRFIVGNVFSYCSTDVTELARIAEPCGPDHDAYLQAIIAEADVLVPCWGRSDKVPPSIRGKIQSTLDTLLASGKPVLTFGLTLSGDPKHPVRLGYATPLVPWGAS